MFRLGCLILALAVAACDPDSARPAEPAAPVIGPAPAMAAPVADLGSYAGRSYADFVTANEARFGNEALGLDADEATRLGPLIAPARGVILDGGGAQALVFRGCAATGCTDGLAIVAIDGATGGAFAGVRDGAGADVLVPNERLEALLRLNAPSRDWADAGASADAPSEVPPAASRP